MIEKELYLFAKTLLSDKIVDFQNIVDDFQKFDTLTFLKTYKKVLEKVIDIEAYKEQNENINETIILQAVGRKSRLLYEVDWSGEEYNGQVKKGISTILKQQGHDALKWKNKNIYKDILSTEPKRGEFLPLLFKRLNEELEDNGFTLAFFDIGDDTYNFFVLPTYNFKKIEGLSGQHFNIIDNKIYDIYLIEKGNNNAKVTLFIKQKFNIPLSEIKSFLQQDKILVETGHLLEVKKYKAKLDEIGATTYIEERLPK